MNLDHEVTSIVVIVILYLAITVEAMLWIEKYHFLCTNYNSNYWKKIKWIVFGSCCFKVVMDKVESLDAQ